MNVDKIQCLVDQGILTRDQADQIIRFSQLPQGTSELLSIIAASQLSSIDNFSSPVGTQTITVNSTTSQALTPQGTKAIVTPYGNSAIFRTDGGAVTTTTGHFLAQGSNFVVNDLQEFRFCAASSGFDVTLYVTYYA